MSQPVDVTFASLLASRLCHDLINPAGALNTGLDVLATESDPEMRQHAESLVAESTSRLLATIDFARTAYGASGGAEGSLGTDDLKRLTEKLYEHLKPTLVWALDTGAVSKLEGRALLNMLLLGERLVPRNGSEVRVEREGDAILLVATGPRARLPEDIDAALKGETVEEEPKIMPARLAHSLATSAGKTITTSVGEEVITLRLS
ncbi:histidine phosphotransferase [Parvularcula sp. ZS-1/3]|uniref:Histidine phosphotransferase n=1 Tax=Parvularcula mediterranea TaxID=2732508 RepID=A0A7Y3W423_9PROT|nr:histidine phosphotransferase family protein [Parvularcula mediterranea]NNU14812.1 histidine phosphotransferase [Parvularcula mediterranea]